MPDSIPESHHPGGADDRDAFDGLLVRLVLGVGTSKDENSSSIASITM
jgi:hypothetical protein